MCIRDRHGTSQPQVRMYLLDDLDHDLSEWEGWKGHPLLLVSVGYRIESFNISKCRGFDMSECRSLDVSKSECRSFHVSKYRTFDISQYRTFDIPKYQTCFALHPLASPWFLCRHWTKAAMYPVHMYLSNFEIVHFRLCFCFIGIVSNSISIPNVLPAVARIYWYQILVHQIHSFWSLMSISNGNKVPGQSDIIIIFKTDVCTVPGRFASCTKPSRSSSEAI